MDTVETPGNNRLDYRRNNYRLEAVTKQSMGNHKRELVMGDQRRRSRSGYITGYWSPLAVDKREDASPINRPLGYEQSQSCLAGLNWIHLGWPVRLLAPVSSAVSQPSRLVA
jgi:hypothetical protein